MQAATELPINTQLLEPLNRITKPRQTKAQQQPNEQAEIDRKFKMAREQGYDQAFKQRRETDKYTPAIVTIFALLALCIPAGIGYMLWLGYKALA